MSFLPSPHTNSFSISSLHFSRGVISLLSYIFHSHFLLPLPLYVFFPSSFIFSYFFSICFHISFLFPFFPFVFQYSLIFPSLFFPTLSFSYLLSLTFLTVPFSIIAHFFFLYIFLSIFHFSPFLPLNYFPRLFIYFRSLFILSFYFRRSFFSCLSSFFLVLVRSLTKSRVPLRAQCDPSVTSSLCKFGRSVHNFRRLLQVSKHRF